MDGRAVSPPRGVGRGRGGAARLIGLSTMMLALHAALPRGATEDRPPRDRVAQLDAYLTRAESFGFSGAVLVASGDTVLLSKGYGIADPTRGIPVTPRTMFDIGSLAKQFTAAAILKLVDEGRLGLDDSLGRFFDSVPPDKATITLHHLLAHTSGLPRESGVDFEDVSARDFVRAVLAAPLQAAPGADFRYSNAGYALLAQVVARVTGRPFTAYMHEAIFEPANLTRTGFVGERRWDPTGVARAVGGELDGESPLDWPLRAAMQGQGSVLTTVEDLYAWIQALLHGAILSPTSTRRLVTPEKDGYAYGWMVRETDRGRRIGHTGVWYAFSSSFRRYLDDGRTIIALSNREIDWIKLANVAMDKAEDALVADITALPPAVVSLDSAVLARYAGEYAVDDTTTVVVGRRRSGVSLMVDSQAGFDLLVPIAGTAVYRAKTAGFNARIDEVWTQTRHDTFSGLGELVSPMRRDAYVDLLREYWRGRGDSLGAYRSHTVLGTLAPYGTNDEFWTYVRTAFEHGEDLVYFWWWGDGRVHGFVTDAQLPEMLTTLRPTSPTDFVAFNLASGVQRGISFRLASDGRATAIAFAMPPGNPVIARRRR